MTTLQLPPLSKREMAELTAKARNLGMTPERFARQLVEEALTFQRQAETSTFAELMAPVREAAGAVDEAELSRLVDKPRTDHHRNVRRKRKR